MKALKKKQCHHNTHVTLSLPAEQSGQAESK